MDSDFGGSVTALFDWPICPRCGQPRSAQCPVCGALSTGFALAEFQNLADGKTVLLHCDDCDDVIEPNWYRLCAACGHDFGGGLEVARSTSDNPRTTWLIIAALIGATLLLAAYFASLFAGV